MKDIPLKVIDLGNGILMCTGTTKMAHGTSDHVRVVEMRLPPMLLDPVATFSIVDNKGNGTIFGVYSVKFGYVNNQAETQVALNAQNIHKAEPSSDDFFCSYIVVGQRLDSK